MKLRCEKLAPHKRFAVRNADPHVRTRLSPKFYQLRRNQRSPPIIGQRPVTFVLDSVVYWRFSLGMEAWIKTVGVGLSSCPPDAKARRDGHDDKACDARPGGRVDSARP